MFETYVWLFFLKYFWKTCLKHIFEQYFVFFWKMKNQKQKSKKHEKTKIKNKKHEKWKEKKEEQQNSADTICPDPMCLLPPICGWRLALAASSHCILEFHQPLGYVGKMRSTWGVNVDRSLSPKAAPDMDKYTNSHFQKYVFKSHFQKPKIAWRKHVCGQMSTCLPILANQY